MALLDKIDALLVLMRHARSETESDAVLLRLQAEVDRLHERLGEPSASSQCPLCGEPAGHRRSVEVAQGTQRAR